MTKTIIAALLTLALFGTAHAEQLTGRVVGVKDGDTLALLVDGREVRVRLAEIDAPEKKQPFGMVRRKVGSTDAYGSSVILMSVHPERAFEATGDLVIYSLAETLQMNTQNDLLKLTSQVKPKERPRSFELQANFEQSLHSVLSRNCRRENS